MADVGAYDVTFVDGPPACGKTTFIAQLRTSLRVRVVGYKAFGLANLLSQWVLRLAPSHRRQGTFDETRDDPILLLDDLMARSLSPVIGVSEVFYKTAQMAKCVLATAAQQTVVDEGVVLRYANYQNAKQLGRISGQASRILVMMDLAFARALARRRRVLYLYLEADDETLDLRWRKRGHKTKYNLEFARLVREGWSYYRPLLSSSSVATVVHTSNKVP
jgi:hypothetical protein